ncbi:anthranilate synthase family protein [Dactylosporangium siamense]|uniref:anthranilate synthase n=1 Tax=Dactylosporangium siamense TaxID=685454 RepID=A0A919Q1N2_9ACTN|nr:anthranilate synthase family protein [Dactylosporangium siamense]GIG52748.1 phenazine-specific anthranilate synthase component I [Dactylosporangium siamense]
MLPDLTRPFALLRREGRDVVEVLAGTVVTVDALGDIPDESLSLVPFRQVRERGFDCVDDGTPLSVLRIASRALHPLADVIACLSAVPVVLSGGAFDVSDDDYATIVAEVLRDEIGRGEGSNFVIHRVFEADVDGDPVTAALAVFRRLLERERGAYWTFLVSTGDRILVGATPERHVSVEDGLVMMNPISGTVRHPDKAALLRFLTDRKEIDELSMVLDEELKMMATVATEGGQVVGPYLKEMAHLVHTEYLLAGRSALDVRDVLRETMFAPTVVGSPIENACRVVARHERRGRGYYGAVLALIGRDAAGRQTLDAPILIRTADISASGRLRVPVGATLVRHSTPAGEVAETHTKAAGVLAALGLGGPAEASTPTLLAADPGVQAALVARNATLAPFWLRDHQTRALATPQLAGRRVLIVDAEDTFTGMLHHQLRVLGLDVTLRKYTDVPSVAGFDLVVLGPGPGDPRRIEEPKMAAMRAVAARLLADGTPTLAVCLGHQLLSGLLGLPLRRKANPYQGMQRDIVFFGRPAIVGFYSTFTATHPHDRFTSEYGDVELSRDPANGDVHALRGPTFAGVQFHPESVLSYDGIELLRAMLTTLLPAAVS